MTGRRFLVSGIVQGVGYRSFAVRAAHARGLMGWVRNLPDGRVEVLAEGDDHALTGLREDLERGPYGAAVRDVHEAETPVSGRFTGFDVRF